MTKDVLISIRGLQFAGPMDEHKDSVEVIVGGQYHFRDGVHFLTYEETTEGLSEKTRTLIKIGKDRVELSKKGGIAVAMTFVEGEKNISNYRTPFGTLIVGIDTTKIVFEEEEERMRLNILYHLNMNYDFVAECNITIDVRSKETGAALFD